MPDFTGKVIAITGAASGMGLATAKHLTTLGASLSLADVQEAALASAAEACKALNPNVKIITQKVDVSNASEVQAWIDRTVSELGQLNGAANIAGIYRANKEMDPTKEEDAMWDFLLKVNLLGVMYCMRSQLGVMGRGSAIVNAASILGIQGAPGAAAYSSSKHGVIGLTRSAAKEVGLKGIRVNCFCPGHINTPMLAGANAARGGEAAEIKLPTAVALGRAGEAEEVAPLIAFLLSEKDSSFITGQSISIDGGWNC